MAVIYLLRTSENAIPELHIVHVNVTLQVTISFEKISLKLCLIFKYILSQA